jgi:hypothetical protein
MCVKQQDLMLGTCQLAGQMAACRPCPDDSDVHQPFSPGRPEREGTPSEIRTPYLGFHVMRKVSSTAASFGA